MHWSAILVLALNGPLAVTEVAHKAPSNSFTSYTQAWHAAHDAERPMLVILNPADEQTRIDEESLRQNEELQPLLGEYVVAVIDTQTEHGKKVHELFGSAPLPRVVVIDKEQKRQIYKTSGKLSHDRLGNILEEYKSGESPRSVINLVAPVNSGCTSCQRRVTF